MGLFGSSKNDLKCKKCGTVLPDSESLKKHQEKAHNKKRKNVEHVELNLIIVKN